jgi:hypothetical protein
MELKHINDMYNKLNYFDQYGASFLFFIIITVAFLIIISYCFTMINIQPVLNDWNNQRCKLNIMPIAGHISKHDGMTNEEFTYQNFVYCTQTMLSSITGTMVEPITFLANSMGEATDDVKTAMNDVRAMFDKIRTFFQTMTQELMGRMLNVTIPLQQIIISMRDTIGKIQGTMTAALFTLLGSFYALQSLMGAIAEFIIILLIALACMIAVFWIFPFTWGAAVANTSIFVAIAIPMAIILTFMMDVLGVKPDLSIPSIKCFDENTLILMSDGTFKPIYLLCVGDLLDDNDKVTATIKVCTKGSKMYDLNGIIVSDSHIVLNNDGKWISVSQHPNSIEIIFYDKPYLYCFNTLSKTINIGENIFTDWDEIYDDTLNMVKNNPFIKIKDNKDIHHLLEGGFSKDTYITLTNNTQKKMGEIQIGDVLKNGENVYGLVEIYGEDIVQHKYEFHNTSFHGGPNLAIYCDKGNKINTTMEFNQNKDIANKQLVLCHLLTNTTKFQVGNIQFRDYNGCIDLFCHK